MRNRKRAASGKIGRRVYTTQTREDAAADRYRSPSHTEERLSNYKQPPNSSHVYSYCTHCVAPLFAADALLAMRFNLQSAISVMQPALRKRPSRDLVGRVTTESRQ